MYYKMVESDLIRLLLCVFLLFQCGCAATTDGGVDIGTLINANKRLDETLPVSTLTAYNATIAALRELNMSITSLYDYGSSVEIKSRFTDNEIAWIEITPINTGSCKVAVIVDVLANESRPRSLLTYILKNLPTESASSELQKVKEKPSHPENRPAGSFEQPAQNVEDGSTVDRQPETLKPLPKEIVTEKSLL